jgi:hypothetical protein
VRGARCEVRGARREVRTFAGQGELRKRPSERCGKSRLNYALPAVGAVLLLLLLLLLLLSLRAKKMFSNYGCCLFLSFWSLYEA